MTAERRRIFADNAAASILFEAIQFVRRERAYVLAFVIMPDHFHALLVPRTPYTISQVMKSIKGYSSREINRSRATKGRLWQPGFYDRVIRSEKQLETAVAYIEQNPVKDGLASLPEEYRWSSAHRGGISDVEAWLAK